MIRPNTKTRIKSKTITTMEMASVATDKKTPTRAGGGLGSGGGLGACSVAAVSLASGFGLSCTGSAESPAGSGASVTGSLPSGTGTMISPPHFGHFTTLPALRLAMPIN
jgi:hypothetical protein